MRKREKEKEREEVEKKMEFFFNFLGERESFGGGGKKVFFYFFLFYSRYSEAKTGEGLLKLSYLAVNAGNNNNA